MPKIQEMAALATMPSCCVKPATTKVRNDTVATVMAYGNCDDTWWTCLHSAPADAMMVVSEIGDTWSPQTAPAMHAEMEMMRSGAVAGNTAMQIGMSMPNVPQEVPVAKASNADTTPIQRQISCNNQNDKKTRVNTNIYSI